MTASRLRPLEEEDLDLILRWRNRPEVRANMFTAHEISLDEHRAWFARVSVDPTRRSYIYVEGAEPLGVVAFTELQVEDRTAAWGFYTADTAPRGVGTRMLSAALVEAFGALGLEKVWSEVLAFNAASLALHHKLGFQIEGRLRAHHVSGSARVDVVRLGLLRGEWSPPSAP